MSNQENYLSCLKGVRPVRDALEVINGKWKLPIILSIIYGNERFIDIQNSIPKLTPKVLSNELKDLEMNKLITRIVCDKSPDPIKILYHPTEYANTLKPIIDALEQWGIKHRETLFK